MEKIKNIYMRRQLLKPLILQFMYFVLNSGNNPHFVENLVVCDPGAVKILLLNAGQNFIQILTHLK